MKKILTLTWLHRLFIILSASLLLARHSFELSEVNKSIALYCALACAVLAIAILMIDRKKQKQNKK